MDHLRAIPARVTEAKRPADVDRAAVRDGDVVLRRSTPSRTGALVGLLDERAERAPGVHVVTVKPGYVRTRMTDGMDLPAPLTATPDEVADAVNNKPRGIGRRAYGRMQSVFRLTARRRPAGSGKACHRAGD